MGTTASEPYAALRQAAVAILLAIVLLAGFTAGIALDRPVASSPMFSGPADIETARAFYRALNEVLAGGDMDSLSALLADSFLEHETGSDATEPAEAFLARLQTIADSSPGIRLEVDSVELLGAILIVAVHQTQGSPALVAGLAVEASVDESSYDMLRVERSKVTDRWTSGIRSLDATTFDEAALHTSGLVGIAPVLKRIVIPAGAQLSWKSGAQEILFVELGSARMTTLVPGDEEAETVMLEAGRAAAIPAAANQRLRPASGETVSVLLYAAPANPPADHTAPARSSSNAAAPALDVFEEPSAEVTQVVLWQGTLAGMGWDRLHHGGRLVLPAGAVVDLVPAPGTAVLVCIDGGVVEIDAPGGTISTLGADHSPGEMGSGGQFDASQAAFIDASSEISLRNTSEHPVALLLIAIDPTPVAPDQRLSN